MDPRSQQEYSPAQQPAVTSTAVLCPHCHIAMSSARQTDALQFSSFTQLSCVQCGFSHQISQHAASMHPEVVEAVMHRPLRMLDTNPQADMWAGANQAIPDIYTLQPSLRAPSPGSLPNSSSMPSKAAVVARFLADADSVGLLPSPTVSVSQAQDVLPHFQPDHDGELTVDQQLNVAMIGLAALNEIVRILQHQGAQS
eukprot:TRINITY_DN8040_c0_g1_i1.p1 TRINITY_DN8040_c0_g1~~TRINITY_DN8040_c0_g1_i1.p1  ORF type:complete len:198 (+),score=33.92 TRINITY_DN8040_c0_g1_i1:355-948(+)